MDNLSQYITIPFKPHGRTKEGVDCWGLVCLIYQEQLSVELPSYEGINWDDGETVSQCIKDESEKFVWVEIAKEDRKECDVVVMRIKGLPWHVGVLLSDKTFIHANPVAGICIERLDSMHWRSRVTAYYRLKQ